MKIAVIAANGKAGKYITNEAMNRGLDVTAIARKVNQTSATKFIQKDLFDLTKEDVKDFDVIIDAFGAFGPEQAPLHTTSLQHLADLLSGTDKRLLIVGGAGSLYVNAEHTLTLEETPDFPEAYKPLAHAMALGLKELRKRNDVKWTYISPAADFQYEAERTGSYTLAGEELTLNTKGESSISYQDYAIAMIDEAIKGNHIQERISVVSK